MKAGAVQIRLMRVEDFNAVVKIDEKVFKTYRPDYYRMKFETIVQSPDQLPTSFVAVAEGGTIVGVVMGKLYIGEYGISEKKASLDTIGVDPDYQQNNVGRLLIGEFMDHLKSLGVQKVDTLVDGNDAALTHFFTANGFAPSRTINLEKSL